MLVRKADLHHTLAHLARLVDRHPNRRILEHVHLHVVADRLVITATDLATWLRSTVPCDGAPLDICLPAKLFLDCVKPAGRHDRNAGVEVTLDGPKHMKVVTSGAETTIETLPAQDFPRCPGGDGAWQPDGTWAAASFRDALSWVLPAASTDMTRPHLGGVYFDNEAVVATDGHRLHLARLDGLATGPTLLPAKSVDLLCRVLAGEGEVVAQRASDLVRFTGGAWELTTKVMAEKFPPYEMVIPAASYETFHTVIEVARLTEAIKRLPKGTRNPGVKLRVNGQLFLERVTDQGSGSATVTMVESTHEGADFEIGVDGRYLLQALTTDETLFTTRFGGPLDPLRLEIGADAQKLAVLMPMRL